MKHRPRRPQRGRQRLSAALMWLLLMTIVFIFSGTALGQTQDEVRTYLERTDELLENAKSIVSDAGSRNSAQSLDQATHNQQNAWRSFDRRQWRLALNFSERARDEIYRALGSIRQTEDNDSEVERQLERTDIVLREAHDRLGLTPQHGPRRRLEMAGNMQRRAWDLYHERRLRPSLQLTLQARHMILRLVDDAGRGGSGIGLSQEGIETRLERLAEAVDRVNERVQASVNQEAMTSVEAARTALDDARRALDAGDLGSADQDLIRARRQLERAMRMVVENIQTSEIGVLINATQERWDLAEQSVYDSGDDQLRDWLEQAAENLDRARIALDEGSSQRALVQTRRAIEFLDRIDDELGD